MEGKKLHALKKGGGITYLKFAQCGPNGGEKW